MFKNTTPKTTKWCKKNFYDLNKLIDIVCLLIEKLKITKITKTQDYMAIPFKLMYKLSITGSKSQ